MNRRLEPGTSILVVRGPLQGLRGTVLGLDEFHRVIVAVAVLRGLLPLVLDQAAVHIDERAAAVRMMAH
jgi:hypothetical protein